MCWTSSTCRRCSSSSSTSATEIVSLLGERVECRQRTRRVPVDDHVAQPVERLLLDRSAELEDCLHGDVTVGRGGELIEGRRRVAERSAGTACDQREGGIRRLDVLTVGDPPEVDAELAQLGPLEQERLAARAHRGADVLQLGRAEDEDEVWRRLLDQLQERVPGCVRQLVRLVEDVDLVATLAGWRITRSRISRMSSIPRCDAASISITSSDVPAVIDTQA